MNYVVVKICKYGSDPGGTTRVMDQERGSCRRLESFGSCRLSGVVPDATGDRLRSEMERTHPYCPSVHMYKGLKTGTGHTPVNRARACTHTHTDTYAKCSEPAGETQDKRRPSARCLTPPSTPTHNHTTLTDTDDPQGEHTKTLIETEKREQDETEVETETVMLYYKGTKWNP